MTSGRKTCLPARPTDLPGCLELEQATRMLRSSLGPGGGAGDHPPLECLQEQPTIGQVELFDPEKMWKVGDCFWRENHVTKRRSLLYRAICPMHNSSGSTDQIFLPQDKGSGDTKYFQEEE